MDESGVVWQLVFYNLHEQGNVWVGMFSEIKTMPREHEAQWWLSVKMCYCLLGGKPSKDCLFSEKEQWLQLHHIKHVLYRPLSPYERDGLAEYLVYSPRFIYVFSSWRLLFCYARLEGGCVCTQFCLWLGLVYLLLRFVFQALLCLYPGIVITFFWTLYYLK
jgi:hypothetical protein